MNYIASEDEQQVFFDRARTGWPEDEYVDNEGVCTGSTGIDPALDQQEIDASDVAYERVFAED